VLAGGAPQAWTRLLFEKKLDLDLDFAKISRWMGLLNARRQKM
jgi:hypothetical protein